MIPAQAHLDERFKAFPNLPEDEYESILAVPILARDKLAGRSTCARGSRASSPTPRSTCCSRSRRRWRSRSSTRSSTPRRSGASRELEALARISEAVSESLYLEESLEAIVKTTMDAVSATGAALVLEDGKIAWPEGRPGTHAVRLPLRWKRRQIGELVCDRDTPFTDEERALLVSIAHHAAVALEHGRAVMRGVLAQEIHHRVKNNLQTVASLLRLQARAGEVDARKALDDSVNRILAIAAVHEVLTEQRDEDVDLDELLDRLRAMLVQGLGPGKNVQADLATVSLAGEPGDRARARLLRAAPERARARRRLGAGRARAAGRQRAAGDHGRRARRHRGAVGHRALDRAGARARRAGRSAGAAVGQRRACARRSSFPPEP